ncbi:MAG: penicillin-binding protein 2 [Clostridia bacterium]|nr:penicillin-binding protein 2 [Clostridia bacterium]
MKLRVVSFAVTLCLLLGVCTWRVVTLQNEPELKEAAVAQATATVTLGTARGTIYDCNRRALVNRDFGYVAAIAPTEKAKAMVRSSFSKPEAAELLERLASDKPIAVKSDTPLALCDGVTLKTLPIRYAGQTIAPHVLGYCNENGGVCGIEYAFDDLLTSYAGAVEVTYAVDAAGKPVAGTAPTVTDTTAKCKGGVVLTIDSAIQQIAEHAAEKMTCGAVVVMEPTGEIRALASVPTYQPNGVEAVLSADNAPLLNRAFADYNCGSVFKIVTASAALEAGASPETEFTCNGGYGLGGNFFRCHYILGHGTLDMKEAFAKSCNPYYIQLALSVGAEPVYDMAVAFGLDRAWTPAPGLSTARATLPSLKTLKSSDAALCNLAFGQGELLATPLHVAQLAAAIVNGGAIYRPTLVAGTVDENGNFTKADPSPAQEVFSKETAKTLYPMMVYTMEEGTGAKGQPYYLPAAAKTGTAETGWVEDGKEVVQHWFTGFFPAERPQYVVTVLCENSEAREESAAPVFQEICDALYLRSLQTNG